MGNVPPVDWGLVTRVGSRLAPEGPSLPQADMEALVAELRQAAARADRIVAETTWLNAPPAADPYVVDRPTWIRWNAELAGSLFAPHVSEPSRAGRVAGAAGAVQIGTVLSWVGQRVLGQFDPFAETPRLLLVAPNIAEIGQRLGVDPQAFRLWVCVHEVTHRYQFGHAPWLEGWLRQLLAEVMRAEPESPKAWLRNRRQGSLVETALGPGGRTALADITAIMSLLEGHADFIMDRTGQIPGIDQIRARFQSRREARGLDAVLRSLTGLDVKHAQYRDGAEFCRQVTERVGLTGLNRAFESPDLLPTGAEIHDPATWVARTS